MKVISIKKSLRRQSNSALSDMLAVHLLEALVNAEIARRAKRRAKRLAKRTAANVKGAT